MVECSKSSGIAFIAMMAILASFGAGCASRAAGRTMTAADAQIATLTNFVREAEDANSRGDFDDAKKTLVKARAGLATASNAVVSHPHYLKLVNELNIAESGVAQAEWLATAEPKIQRVTSEAKVAAEKAMRSHQAFNDPEIWGSVAQSFSACRATIFDLKQLAGYNEGQYVDSAFGSLPLANIDAQCAKSEKQATLARDQAEHRTTLAKRSSSKHKKSGKKSSPG